MPTTSKLPTARISRAATTTRTAGKVNPAAGLCNKLELESSMISKTQCGFVEFQIFVSIRLCGLAKQLPGTARAVPVTRQLEFPDKITAGDDQLHFECFWTNRF